MNDNDTTTETGAPLALPPGRGRRRTVSIDKLCNLVCRDLPADWELSIVLEAGAGIVVLYDPLGNRQEDACDITEDIETQVKQSLGYARAEGGAP